MRTLIDRIESAIHCDVGRGMDAIFQATSGGLWGGASAFAATGAPRVGLITGFYVPSGDPPAAETDGPAGAALMGLGFVRAGLSCRLATDTLCQAACRVGLNAASAGGIMIDAVAPGESVDALIKRWREDGIDWVIAIERCGPAADGRSRNMRGIDMSAHAASLDKLFTAGPWRTIGIGDGGNELGMGHVPRSLITQDIALGEAVGCVVPADFLIAAGVSHWGSYAVLAALALLRPDWSPAMLTGLDPALDQAVVEAIVRDGPAVDGVSLRSEPTIDSLRMERHREILLTISALVSHGRG